MYSWPTYNLVFDFKNLYVIHFHLISFPRIVKCSLDPLFSYFKYMICSTAVSLSSPPPALHQPAPSLSWQAQTPDDTHLGKDKKRGSGLAVKKPQLSYDLHCVTLGKSFFLSELKCRKVHGGGWRRQWHPTPVLLPGKSQGWRSPVG